MPLPSGISYVDFLREHPALMSTAFMAKLDVDFAGGGGGSGTVTSVALSGGTTGLTTFGSPITTSGTITLDGILAVAHGGTGLAALGTGVEAALGAVVTGSGGFALAVSPTFTSPALGTPASGVLTSCSGLSLTTGVTGTLATTHGGTGVTTAANGQLLIGNGSGFALAALTAGSNITITNAAGTITIDATGSGGGTVTSVSGAGGGTGLTLTGGPITAAGTLTLGGTLNVAHGGTGAATLTGILLGNGTSAFTIATPGTDYVAPGSALTWTAKQTFNGSSSTLAIALRNAIETYSTVASPATGTINYDVTSGDLVEYTTNATGNWTLNFRGNAGQTLNSLLANDESVTVTFVAAMGATPYYANVIQVDGTAVGVTVKWLSAAPVAGIPSADNIYTLNIKRTSSGNFRIRASFAAWV